MQMLIQFGQWHHIDTDDVDFYSGHFAQQQIVFVVGKRLFSPTTNCWSALFFTLFLPIHVGVQDDILFFWLR